MPDTFPTYGPLTRDTVYTARAQNYVNRKVKNQYFKITPTLAHLRSKKKVEDGGERIKTPVYTGATAKGKFYPRAGGVPMQHTDPVTHAFYQWAFFLEPIVLFHQDERIARGKEALYKLIDIQTEHAGMRSREKIAQALFGIVDSDESDFALDSLYDAMPADPTSSGTYGDLDGAANAQSYWRNQTTSSVVFSTSGVSKMRELVNACSKFKGYGKPTLLVTTQDIHEEYESEASDKQEIRALVTQSSGIRQMADLGFDALSFKGIPVVWDPYCVATGSTHRMLALNDEAIQLVEMDECWDVFPFERGLLSGIVGRGTGMRYEAQLVTYARAPLGYAPFTLS